MSNRKLGKYDIHERLGRGGMAEVYKGYHANLDRYVAIKVLHAFLADDPEFKDRFLREAQNVARLKHPNIVQVYDFDFDPDGESYYMVMELIEGPTLKDRLANVGQGNTLLPLEETLRIMREAAGALAYAHSRGMIHRDVKPANLMIDHDERVVLTDFGIAKIVTGAHFTASGGMVGTPAYMAPEQGLGEAGDERSDLYSLGVILYQLLTGELPYDAEAPLAIILQHLNKPTPSVRSKHPEYPEVIDQLVMRLLAKDVEERYQSANDLIEDLDRIERGEALAPSRAIAVTNGSPNVIPAPGGRISGNVVAGRPASPRSRVPLWLLGGIGAAIILFGGYIVGMNNGMFPQIALLTGATETPTPSPTATDTPSPTDTPSLTPTETATLTPSDTPTITPSTTETLTHTPTDSPTPTDTPTATDTPTITPSPTNSPTVTHTPTATATPTDTLTPTITLTPTPDVTQTLLRATQLLDIQTATTAACDFDYLIVNQNPIDGDFYSANTPYEREIRLLNSGNCSWERNTSFVFVQDEDFDARPIFLRERINPGQELALCFQGVTPRTGGLYTGVWELRTPGQILIGDPFEITVNVFETNTPREVQVCGD